MILRLFALRDVKAGVYQVPFAFANDAVALRAVKDMLEDAREGIGRHASDYEVFCVGLYDQETGSITGLDKPEFVVQCAALMEGK